MRPTTRPEKPYTPAEILDRVYAHFITEKNPRCADKGGQCRYDKTGCAVGCLLTIEDAENLERSEVGYFYAFTFREPKLYAIYFGKFTGPHDLIYRILCRLQNCHDSSADENIATRIADGIADLRKEFNL